MFTRLRPHLTYANVMASIAVSVAMGGGAYALTLPRNSVGSPQIKRNAVGASEIRQGAVGGSVASVLLCSLQQSTVNLPGGWQLRTSTINAP